MDNEQSHEVAELTKLIPGYQIDELLTVKQSGSVYQGRQVSLDRNITLKVLSKNIASNTEYSNAFKEDAQKMARLKHVNLVEVFDFGNIDGMLYMVTDSIPGRSLYETAHDKHVDPQEAARLIANIASGLDYAHQAGVVHLRLNPKNVLINNEAEPKIIEFGLSGLSSTLLSDEDIHYVAPEIFTENQTPGAQADIYSLGIMLYELVVGYPPTNPYIPPSDVRDVDPAIDIIIYNAIQEDPSLRYATARAMINDLETFLSRYNYAPDEEEAVYAQTPTLTAAPTSVATPLPISKLSDVKTRNTGTTFVTLIIMAALCYGVYWYYKNHLESETPPPAQEESIENKFIIRK